MRKKDKPTKSTNDNEFQPGSKPQQSVRIVAKRACEGMNSLTIGPLVTDNPSTSKGRTSFVDKVPTPTFSSSSGSRSNPTSSNASPVVKVWATNPTPARARPTVALLSTSSSSSSSSLSSDSSPSPPTKKQKKSELLNNFNEAAKKKSQPLVRIPVRNEPKSDPFPKKTSTSTSSDSDSSSSPNIVQIPARNTPRFDPFPKKTSTSTSSGSDSSPNISPPRPTLPVGKVTTLTTTPTKGAAASESKGSDSDNSSSTEDDAFGDSGHSGPITIGRGHDIETGTVEPKLEPPVVSSSNLPRAVRMTASPVSKMNDFCGEEKPVEPKIIEGGLKTVRRRGGGRGRGRGRGQFKSGSQSRASDLRLRPRGLASSVEVGEQISKKSTASKNGGSNDVAQSGKWARKSKATASGPSQGQGKFDPYIAPGIADNVLFNAALYGGYTMQCLPRAPVTEEEKRIETLKVFGYYREEIEAEKKARAEYLKAQALAEYPTRANSERQNGGNPGVVGVEQGEKRKPKRDLSDFDSYNVLGKIVEADGTTRHLIEWKTPGLKDESDDSDGQKSETQTGQKNWCFRKKKSKK